MRALTSVDLPTPEWPDQHAELPGELGPQLVELLFGERPAEHDAAQPERRVDGQDLLRARPGRPWSGRAPARGRRRTRRPGTGRSASAGAAGRRARVTITSWSALATMTRSIGSVSSADLRSTLRRGAILTTRARVPGSPETSPTRPTVSPTTMFAAAEFAGLHRGDDSRSPIRHRYLPRSTAVTNASTASACAGRRLVRGRDPRPGLTRTSSSSKSAVTGPAGVITGRFVPPASGSPPSAGELGERLADGRGVPAPARRRYDEAEHGGRHHQAVIVVAVERRAAAQRARA